MRYPHYEAEFLVGVFVIGLLAAIVLPVARALPAAISVPLSFVPLALLIGWFVWTWRRVRRG